MDATLIVYGFIAVFWLGYFFGRFSITFTKRD